MTENWRSQAALQHGAISRGQLIARGHTSGTIRTLLQREELLTAGRGVYRLTGAPRSWKQDLFVSHLIAGAGSVVSHRSAGMEWGLDAVRIGYVEISSPRKLRAVSFRSHRTLSIRPDDVSDRGGLPVTNPTRTLLDLGLVLPLPALERAFESALRKELTDQRQLLERFETWARSGRNGVTKWRHLLEMRRVAAQPTESYLETLLMQAARKGALPEPTRQFSLQKQGSHLRRFDFAYPEHKVLIEADGAAWHLGREAWGKDLAAQNEAASLGWLVLRFTYRDVTIRPDWVISTVGHVLRQRRSA